MKKNITPEVLPKIKFYKSRTCSIVCMELTREKLKFDISAPDTFKIIAYLQA